CTKFAPIGYVTPGNSRKLIPKNGSRKTPSSTSEPTTVDGTVARYQSVGRYVGEEIAAPSTPTFADDWMSQPVCNIIGSCATAVRAAQKRRSDATALTATEIGFTLRPPLNRM